MELIACSWLCHIVNRILASCIKTTANEKHVGQRGKWPQLTESEVTMAKQFSKQLHQSKRTAKAETRDSEGKDGHQAGPWEVKGHDEWVFWKVQGSSEQEAGLTQNFKREHCKMVQPPWETIWRPLKKN